MSNPGRNAGHRVGRVPTDVSAVLVKGPWSHRYVAGNGARFHIAETREGPLVVFLHGFPQFWWTWRHQLPAVSAAGYRAVAMDLRGYGASDKPPQGYDAVTLAGDVAGVIRCLGENRAVIVGHGIGGQLAWSMPLLHGDLVRAIGVIGAAHPVVMSRFPWAHPARFISRRGIIDLQRRHVAEHRLQRDPDYVEGLLRRWASPASEWPSPEEAALYAKAMSVPFTAQSCLESHRWLLNTSIRPDGWRYLSSVNHPVPVPVLQIHGVDDRAVTPSVAARSERYTKGQRRWEQVKGAGHFPQEESPEEVTRLLVGWLSQIPA